MSAARIVTTTEKFDEMGKLVERITEEKILEKHECKCEKQKKAESSSSKDRKIEEAEDLAADGFRVFPLSELMREFLKESERMRMSGVPCPFYW